MKKNASSICQEALPLLWIVGLLLAPAFSWGYFETDLMALSIEELTSLEVTSVSRTVQEDLKAIVQTLDGARCLP